ncbi:MAG: ABC transporter substrate-binding protein [Elusimicrobiota bacterium]|jgi:peptide/nickel transport system substrate-binding protein
MKNSLAIAAFAWLWAGALCAQTPSTGTQQSPASDPETFVHLTTRQWFTLDPADAFDSVSSIVIGNVYEPLIAFKSIHAADAFEPFLAEKVPSVENGLLSKDRTAYSFPIRKGVLFHDGSPLTPEDVRYSLLRFMLQDMEGGPSSLLLHPIMGVYGTRGADGKITLDFKKAAQAVRVDGDKVIVELHEPCDHFLKVLASLPIIVSKSWAVAHGEWDGTEKEWERYNNQPRASTFLHEHMNGTGPFELEKVEPEKQLVLKRNEHYWRKPAALARVFLRIVPHRALRLSMLENGDADSSFMEDQDFSQVQELPQVKVIDGLPNAALGEVLFFTFAVEPDSEFLGSGKLDGQGIPPDFFKDRSVREGFAYAFDYEGYLKNGMGLRGKRAAGPVCSRLLAGQDAPPYAQDLDKSAAAFKKAYGGALWEKGFTLTLSYSHSNPSRQVIAQFLQASLEKINPRFKVRLRHMQSAKLYDLAEHNRLPLFIAGYYADYPDAQAFVFELLHSQGYFPKAQRYSNPKLDALIDEANCLQDAGKRNELYRRISRLAQEDLAQIYTYEPTRFQAARDNVQGFQDEQNIGNLNLNNFPYFYALSKSAAR